jgi:dienelactone hydrolase
MKYFIALIGLWFTAVVGAAEIPQTVTFDAADGVTVTADVYMAHPQTAPFIVLFHQARYSRGEYVKIAPKLNALGFNAMAIDQRSGYETGGIKNETAQSAKNLKKSVQYLDALPDMEAAVSYARKNYAKGKLLIWGSSYSASLVLKMAGDKPSIVDGVLAFSPGEDFGSADLVKKSAQNIRIPVFITSARSEKNDWSSIYETIPGQSKKTFLPAVYEGFHGSSALFIGNTSDEYWQAVEAFLSPFVK